MRETLFRREVLEAQSNRFFGAVLVHPPWSVTLFFALLTAGFSLAILFLAFGSYHRKERAFGVLLPSAGLVKILPPRSGIVDEIRVTEGQSVQQGQMLFSLKQGLYTGQGQDIAQLKGDEVEHLLEKLSAQRDALPERQRYDEEALRAELELADRSISNRQQKIQNLSERLTMKKHRQARLNPLIRERLISQDEADKGRDERLQVEGQLKDEQQLLFSEMNGRQQILNRLTQLPVDYQKQEGDILKEIAAARQQLYDFSLQGQQWVSAPIAGRVSSLQIYKGMTLEPKEPVLALLPDGNRMEAHLFIPTRAVGFIAEGQDVLLRYEAFPYQKYGVYQGTIQSVTRSALQPGEIKDVELKTLDEPVYRIIVQLRDQVVRNAGKELPLQSGMLVQAEIVLEERSLWRWFVNPLSRLAE